jgi:isopenicillin N synthase-like dioxygenase
LLNTVARSNDVLKSNLHRVVEPPADRVLSRDKETTKGRFSILFFVQADRKKVVQCVKELESSSAKYPPVSAEEYLNMRRKATFKKFQSTPMPPLMQH